MTKHDEKQDEHNDFYLERRRRKADWNITALAIFVVVHSAATIWWASKITARQEFMIETIAELKMQLKYRMDDNYSGADASRDFAVRDQRINDLEERIGRLEGRK